MTAAEDSPEHQRDQHFPVYRRMAHGKHFYRIEGPAAFTDVQLVGSRSIVHVVSEAVYPERVRITHMLACEPPYVEMDAAEWDALYARIG